MIDIVKIIDLYVMQLTLCGLVLWLSNKIINKESAKRSLTKMRWLWVYTYAFITALMLGVILPQLSSHLIVMAFSITHVCIFLRALQDICMDKEAGGEDFLLATVHIAILISSELLMHTASI